MKQGQTRPSKRPKSLIVVLHKLHKSDDASPEERFWAKVDKSPGQGPRGDCWGWLASTFHYGYGQLNVDGTMVAAHRFSYELHHGPIPEGKIVRHTCDNPPCTSPDHLLLGTNQDNTDDMVARGRSMKGDRNGQARLTDMGVLAIRQDTRFSPQIAVDYGVSASTIRRIKAGALWGHVVRRRNRGDK